MIIMFILYMFITYYLFVVVQTDGWGIIRELIWVIACHHKLDLLAYYYTTLSLNHLILAINHLILAIKSIQGVYSNSLINQSLMACECACGNNNVCWWQSIPNHMETYIDLLCRVSRLSIRWGTKTLYIKTFGYFELARVLIEWLFGCSIDIDWYFKW